MGRMSDYILREPLGSSDGVKSHRALLLITQEEVYLHELPAGTAELYDLSLNLYRSQQIDRPLLDFFSEDGKSFVVTRPRAETVPFRPWLRSLRPDVAIARAPLEMPKAIPISPPGEFTQIFQAQAPSSGPANPPLASPQPLPKDSKPGEFTQLFQAGAPSQPSRGAAAPNFAETNLFPLGTVAGKTTGVGKHNVNQSAEADEFSSILHGPPVKQSPMPLGVNSDAMPLAKPQTVGDFTLVFGKEQAASKPSAPGIVTPREKEPGEFTRLLNPQPAPPRAENFRPSQPLQIPAIIPERAPQSPPPSVPAGNADPFGGATQIFVQPSPSPRAPAAPVGGVGEFTRIFQPRGNRPNSAPAAPAVNVNPAPAQIQVQVDMPSVSLPSAPSMPSAPSAPSMPSVSIPSAPSIPTSGNVQMQGGASPSWLPLLIAANAVVVILIALMLYFLLKK